MLWQIRQGLIAGRSAVDGVVDSASTTWNPSDKNAAIALSGGNLTATSSAGSGSANAAVRATNPISATIKTYFEVTVSGTVGQYLSIGVMNGSATLSNNVGAVNGASMVNKLDGSFKFYVNASEDFSGPYPNLVSGQVIRVAIDRANNKMWVAVNNNTWSGSAVWMGSGGTTDDPATGVGGKSISPVTGAIYPAISSAWTGDVCTLNPGPTFAYPVPTGFSHLT